MKPNAAQAGTFKIGGELEVNRLGFGAMRIVGDDVWGPPADRDAALGVLRRLPAFGVNFIDTADSYGPYHSEELIHEALHPYEGMVVATKAGLVRHGPGKWLPLGRPEYLRHACLTSLRRLGILRIDLYQLHRVDPKVPREEQFAELRALQEDGLVRHIGLSQASIEDIEAAREFFEVATVQNRYNLAERRDEEVLKHCEAEGIGFIPWYPLGAGKLTANLGVDGRDGARDGSARDGDGDERGGGEGGADESGDDGRRRIAEVVTEIAGTHRATPSQIALAWLLARSPVMLPIPGTGSPRHLIENVGAAAIKLSKAEMESLNQLGG